jgi:hypothetical protein
MSTVTFATCCWERDWRPILLDPEYLRVRQIENHRYPFAERILIINNVKNLSEVYEAAQKHVDAKTLTRIVIAEEIADKVLPFFQLERSDFANDWVYYNALAPLAAIYSCKTDFLLYMTGDASLDKPVSWIDRAIKRMLKEPAYKVANLTWNDNYQEAKRESAQSEWYFYVAERGFSDQQFLVQREDFQQPIYREIHPCSHHFPRGDVFEKRVFSAMIHRGWKRITYRRGSYWHRNFV